ncbi:MAG: membrane protein insertase YidC [Deltaproteobacteria bacterium]|nr:membrane protein insertase YidC [Deltaproteobacteria bacterium]
MDRRALLATILTLTVWLGYLEYTRRTAPPPPPPGTQTATGKADSQAPTAEAPADAPAPEPADTGPSGAPPPALTAAPEAPEKAFVYENSLYRAEFTNRGGRLRSLQLKRYAQTLDADSPRVQLVSGSAAESSALGVSLDAGRPIDLEHVTFEAFQEPESLTFRTTLAGGLAVTKRLRFRPDTYLFSMEVSLHNGTGRELPLGLGVLWRSELNGENGDRFSGHAGPIALAGTSVEREDLNKLEGEELLEGPILWAGFETKYFIAALAPDQPDRARVRVWKPDEKSAASAVYFPPTPVPTGASTSQTVQIYGGPKVIEDLKAVGVGLEQAVDFGFFAVLAKPLLWILNFFERFVGNYGVAIILLTCLIRIAFFPLATKQFRSMKEMQRLQPLLQELREKYKEDRERLNQETMQLFRTHKVNPLGGCLPIVVQIPVFFALYQALLNSIALRQAPFMLWLKDLSAPDPTYIAPILMTGSMFLQQKMAPPAGDPTQQKIMMMMPLVFGVMFLNFPSGLVLYWLANNLLAIAQQWWINRRFA